MSDYEDFPPLTLLKKVLQFEPQSALLFVNLWKFKEASNRLPVKKTEVKNRFLLSPTIFRNQILALGRLDILSFEETCSFFLIDFVATNND